jgi:hypothetical protein
MSYDLSLVVPSIRPHLHNQLYETATSSCNRHKFEIVIVGPYKPPENLLQKENFIWIEDWGSPSRCAQIGAINSRGVFLYHTTDDVRFKTGQISNAFDLAKPDVIVACKYSEWYEYEEISMPEDYWVLRGLPCYKPSENKGFEQLNQDWGCFCQFIVDRQLFLDYGGFDAENFEYLNHVCHDFLFRVQRNGIKTVESKEYVCNARWLQATQEDHGPIFYSQMFSDLPKFNEMWSTPNNRGKIDLHNFLRAEPRWTRRFGA